MSDKPRLSVSSINMLMRCGQQYVYRYLQGKKQPPGISLLVGRGTHKSVEHNLLAKRDTGRLLPLEEVKDIARDALEQEFSHEAEIAYSPDERAAGEATVKGKAVDTTVSLAELHAVKCAPAIEPVHVERKWIVEVEGCSHDLMGYIDIQEANAIRDTKTTGKTPPASAADDSMQLTAYAMAATVIDGRTPPTLALDYLISTKTPKAVTLETKREPRDFEQFLARFSNAVEVIQKGAFMPAPPDSWACSERWCGYWHECPFARRPKSVNVTNEVE